MSKISADTEPTHLLLALTVSFLFFLLFSHPLFARLFFGPIVHGVVLEDIRPSVSPSTTCVSHSVTAAQPGATDLLLPCPRLENGCRSIFALLRTDALVIRPGSPSELVRTGALSSWWTPTCSILLNVARTRILLLVEAVCCLLAFMITRHASRDGLTDPFFFAQWLLYHAATSKRPCRFMYVISSKRPTSKSSGSIQRTPTPQVPSSSVEWSPSSGAGPAKNHLLHPD